MMTSSKLTFFKDYLDYFTERPSSTDSATINSLLTRLFETSSPGEFHEDCHLWFIKEGKEEALPGWGWMHVGTCSVVMNGKSEFTYNFPRADLIAKSNPACGRGTPGSSGAPNKYS
jgi:hypothetical protein